MGTLLPKEFTTFGGLVAIALTQSLSRLVRDRQLEERAARAH